MLFFFLGNFIVLLKKKRKYVLQFSIVKITRKHLAIAVKYIKDDENRITFNKHVEITDGKTFTIYSALSNEIEKCSGVESLGGFWSDGASVMIEHKEVALELKRNNPKIIFFHYHNHRLAFTIPPFFKESITYLMKNNYLLC